MSLPTGLHLHFDCFAGIAGDMTLAALLDLGVPRSVVDEALASLAIDGLRIESARVKRGGMAALHVTGPKDDAHHRHYRDIRRLIDEAALAPRPKALAQSVFRRLAEAEAKMHAADIEAVHFHEVGGLDAIADIVGVSAAIAHLQPSSVTASVVSVGGGTVRFSHGELPVPAPATAELLRGVPVQTGPAAVELTTPTGAALITELASRFGALPPQVLVAQGYGAGTRELSGAPNVLRVLAGEPRDDGGGAASAGWLEVTTNIDDMNPEWGPHVVARLLAGGAADAWQTPVVMKKGRAGIQLGFLCRRPRLEALAAILFAESSTIGLRYRPVARLELPRRRLRVSTAFGEVRVKFSGNPGGPYHRAPEHEDCAARAAEHGVSVKEVYQAASVAAAGLSLDDIAARGDDPGGADESGA